MAFEQTLISSYWFFGVRKQKS